MNTITEFQGKHRFLSNFWPASVILGGIEYPTVEHAYQAAKSIDPDYRKRVLACERPGKAKRLSRSVTLRSDWESVKVDVMFDLVKQKFTRHEHLKNLLFDTGNSMLIEGNKWGDTFWGVCRGQGQNHLGKILMTIRKEIKETE